MRETQEQLQERDQQLGKLKEDYQLLKEAFVIQGKKVKLYQDRSEGLKQKQRFQECDQCQFFKQTIATLNMYIQSLQKEERSQSRSLFKPEMGFQKQKDLFQKPQPKTPKTYSQQRFQFPVAEKSPVKAFHSRK